MKTLKQLFKEEKDRAREAKLTGKKFVNLQRSVITDAEYKKECAMIPKSAFDNLIFREILPRDFKMYWPNRSVCTMAVLPFNEIGMDTISMKEQGSFEEFILRRRFLKLLSVMPISGMTVGYPNMGDNPGYYFDLLPEILKKDIFEGGCSFEVEYFDGELFTETKDRELFSRNCEKALKNLKTFLFGK